jgi:hypothetical protein
LSPTLQRKLANTIYDPSIREELFPGIKSLYVVTHSHHFLDHVCFDNNFSVSRSGLSVNLTKINSITESHDLVFNMLGDDLSSLFLPEVIILMEGDSDVIFLRKILSDIFPGVLISLVSCGGDGKVANEFNRLRQVFPDYHCTPYRNRTLIVLDAKNNTKTGAFTRVGIPVTNVVRLKKNGIEYYYPTAVLSKIFGVSEDICKELTLDSNNIYIGGVSKSKVEIAKDIVSNLTTETKIDDEIISEIVQKVETIIGKAGSNQPINADGENACGLEI